MKPGHQEFKMIPEYVMSLTLSKVTGDLFSKAKKKIQVCFYPSFIPALRRKRRVDLCELEDSLVYRLKWGVGGWR